MNFIINENPSEKDINEVRHRLQEHNSSYWEVDSKYKFTITLKNGNDLIGGIIFTIFGEWLEIDFFWVNPNNRAKGYGKQLLDQAEDFAKKKGCKMSFLNTFNFQAKPFYEKNGYLIVHTQKCFPVTNTRYLMEKQL